MALMPATGGMEERMDCMPGEMPGNKRPGKSVGRHVMPPEECTAAEYEDLGRMLAPKCCTCHCTPPERQDLYAEVIIAMDEICQDNLPLTATSVHACNLEESEQTEPQSSTSTRTIQRSTKQCNDP
jgi:hypothetical protein